MADFKTEYVDAATDKLEINYRSSDEIVKTLEAVAPHLGASHGMLPLSFSAANGTSGIRPQIRAFDTIEQEAEGIAASIVELHDKGVPFRGQAVLCRSNARLNEIANALEV